jgi:GGDEF domain-containing protein
MELGYMLLVGLSMVQVLLIYLKLYMTQTYTIQDIVFSMATLFALLIGFFVPFGISVVGIFIFMVGYFVWLVTYAPVNVLTLTWLLIIPVNILIAAFIKTRLIRTQRIMERLEALKDTNPEIDLDTNLGNKDALEDAVMKQSNLARRYSEHYGFSMAMFKIEFLPLVLESLGSERYAQLLLELSNTIQQQIRYEDYKFSIEDGRFIILCPMTSREHFHVVTDRIKNAMMDLAFMDKKGLPLKLVVRAGAMEFQKEHFSHYERIDEVIAALERRTETDLVGEYI